MSESFLGRMLDYLHNYYRIVILGNTAAVVVGIKICVIYFIVCWPDLLDQYRERECSALFLLILIFSLRANIMHMFPIVPSGKFEHSDFWQACGIQYSRICPTRNNVDVAVQYR